MSLNIPDTRQRELAQRLEHGQQIIATDVAAEFDVSIDTIRRDILSLEAAGKAERVRGGAVPLARPASPIHARLATAAPVDMGLVNLAITAIGSAQTLLIDGGVTTLALIAHLPDAADRFVITPSPWIAIACQERGIPVFLLGGALSPSGGIATGEETLGKVLNVAADIALLGACGIDSEFGLSSDIFEESQMKRAMQRSAQRTFIITDRSKFGRRARHHTLAWPQIDLLLTDASQTQTEALSEVGAQILSAGHCSTTAK
ncbi:MAG: DeoR/GlpR family DNA-binding transcription regulator [Pseudoruegeria sp.]